ncbi:MAG: hypothetical protein J5676_11660 [Bacteroidaceae bacterium]|nr:hypothetical protein [Bacteroidaceae bacterium]
MSIDLSLVIPNKCRSLRDKKDARKCFDDTIEGIVNYFHGRKQFITDIKIYEDESEFGNIEYSFDILLLNITANMYSGFWDIWPVARYSQYFFPCDTDMFGKPRIWPREVCFNTLLAFGQNEGWICDEYHSWNSLLDEEKTTFEDWKSYGETAEDSKIYEFNVMDFADVDPLENRWPEYKKKYHDDFKECHAVLDAVKKRFPQYDILAIGEPFWNTVVAVKDDGMFLLHIETGESFTNYPIDNCRTDFNGAGIQIFRGEESAFFNRTGEQLTDFRVGDFSWKWDNEGGLTGAFKQIVIDEATGKKFFTDGTPYDK